MSLASVQTHMDLATDAYLAGEYQSAIDYATAALGQLGAVPNSEGPGGGSMNWARREELNQFIARAKQRLATSEAASVGLQTSKITYARVSG